jgi:hypothetical protein
MTTCTCPHCGGEISPAAIIGKEGGKKSRRKITPEQQAKMQAARKLNASKPRPGARGKRKPREEKP